jgi:putative transposase
MATVLDLFSRRLLACPTSEHPNAQLACDGIKIAAACGGRTKIEAVIFHTDYAEARPTPRAASPCCVRTDSESGSRWGGSGRTDNAAAESFFSTLEHEVLSRHHFTTKAEARTVVLAWRHEFYNTGRRHSSAAMMTPADYERTAAQPADGKEAAR